MNPFLRKIYTLIFVVLLVFNNIGASLALNDLLKVESSDLIIQDAGSIWIFFLSAFAEISDNTIEDDPECNCKMLKAIDSGFSNGSLENQTNLLSFNIVKRHFLGIKANKFQRLFLLYHCLKIALI